MGTAGSQGTPGLETTEGALQTRWNRVDGRMPRSGELQQPEIGVGEGQRVDAFHGKMPAVR